MRELFYRRETRGGYKVVAREASLSAKEEAFCAQKALPVSAGEIPLFTYKQCCTDTGALLVSCGYIDPHGSRGSGLAHALMTEGDAERAALLGAYPASSDYFERFRDRYSQSVDPMELENKPLRVPLEEYLGGNGSGPAEAAHLLRETFGSEELLAQLFDALLDCASANPRMVVVVLEGETMDSLPQRGRRIAESLFACLPDVVSTRLGYLSPALNLSDVTFALRFVDSPDIAKSSSMVYTVQPSQGRFAAPANLRRTPGDYPRTLAAKVMDGGPEAIDWIRENRSRLCDWSVFTSKSVDRDIALRYAFYTRPDALEPEEARRLLDWRHEMVRQAAEDPEILENSAFWDDVDRWLTQRLIPDLWAHVDGWKRGEVLYDSQLVRQLFEDAWILHGLGRPEAAFFRDLLKRRLEDDTLCPQAQKPGLRVELIQYFADRVGGATEPAFADGLLYWTAIEPWIRAEWSKGALLGNEKAADAVRRLAALNPEAAKPYMDAYVRQLAEGRLPVSGSSAEFHRNAVNRLLREQPGAFESAMTRELGGANPFQSESALARYRWYASCVSGDGALRQRLNQLAGERLKDAAAALGPKDVGALLDELNGDPGAGLLAAAETLGLRAEAASEMEGRVAALLGQKGFYDYYPQDRERSGRIADILDRAGAYDRVRWSQRLVVLDRVGRTDVTDLGKVQFDNYIRACDGEMDDPQRRKATAMLWGSIQEAAEAGRLSDSDSLLWALAMKSYEKGTISPSAMARDAEKLGVAPARFRRLCAKHADDTAWEGLGYLAAEVQKYLKAPGEGDVRRRYPGNPRAAAKAEAARETSAGALAGLPMAVPVAGVLLFGGGLAGSAVTLLRLIGLF